MRILPLLCCAVLATSAVSNARPRKQDNTASTLKEAERLYNVGKYREAGELLEQVNEQQPNPKLLYNIARAYDQAGDLEKSLDYYQRYVGSKDGTDPTLLKRAVLSIDRLKGLIAKSEEDRRRQEEARLKAEEDAKAAQARADADAQTARKALEEAEARSQTELAATQRARSRNKTIAIGSGVVGLLALGGGTYMGLSARGSRAEYDAATTVADKRRFQDAAKTQSLLADVGFGIGIAAVATAIFMWPKSRVDAEEEESEEESDDSDEEASMQWFIAPTGAAMQVTF